MKRKLLNTANSTTKFSFIFFLPLQSMYFSDKCFLCGMKEMPDFC